MSPAERLRAAAVAAPQVIQPHEVALAVAAWLEDQAEHAERSASWGGDASDHAYAVADALLQTQPVKP